MIRRHRVRAVRIDEVCRFLFPIMFAIFNGLYWTYYRDEADSDDAQQSQQQHQQDF